MTSEQDKSHNSLLAINFLNNKVLPCFLNCKNKKIISDQAIFTYIATNSWKIPFIFNKKNTYCMATILSVRPTTLLNHLAFLLKAMIKV